MTRGSSHNKPEQQSRRDIRKTKLGNEHCSFSKDQLKCFTLAKKYLVFSSIHWENGLRQTLPFRYPKINVYVKCGISQIIVCCMSDAHCLCPVGTLIILFTLIKKVWCPVFTCRRDNDDQVVSSSGGSDWHMTTDHSSRPVKYFFCKPRNVKIDN